MAFGHLKKNPQDIYRVSNIEVEPGCSAVGMDSSSPEWMHECEVRQLSQLDHKQLVSYLSGARSKRGNAAVDRLTADVELRKEAMAKTGINSPMINMRVFERIERERSGAVAVVATDITPLPQESTPKVRTLRM